MVVTGHQPNLLPGVSVTSKIAAADVWIVCDEMQFVRHGWVNRNRLADGTPLTVPYDHRDRYQPINRVRIGNDARWRSKLTKTLQLRFGATAGPYVEEIARPWRRLVGLNMALLRQLLGDLDIDTPMVMQSHLDSGGYRGPLDTADGDQLADVSQSLAAMTEEVGGTVWLAGPSGRNYLDETAFAQRGITVRYHAHAGPNPSAIELVAEAAHDQATDGLRALMEAV